MKDRVLSRLNCLLSKLVLIIADSNDKTLLAYENETLVEDGSDKKIKVL